MSETAPTRLAAPALLKASFKPLRECNSLGEAFESSEFRERIAAAAPSHVKPGRLLQTFIGAVSKNPLLRECSVRSYIGACLTLSQTGFEANTALGHAYLIPFRESKWNPVTRQREPVGVNINVIFGYPGLLDLSYRTGLVRNIHPDVVFPGDEFSFEYGSNAHLKHIPRARREGDTPLFAYMHATLKDGQAFEVMPYADVLAIRNKAQAYRYALEAKEKAEAESKRVPSAWTEAPWVAHEFAMARKTAVRAGSKWLPRSVELHSAIALEDAQERGRGVDFGSALDAPTIDGTPDYLAATADASREDRPDPDEPAPRSRQVVDATAAFSRRSANPPAPAFEAVLINAFGEIEGEFTSPLHFAQAYLALLEAADDELRAVLFEHNADALEEVGQYPDVARMLTQPAQEHRAPPTEKPPVSFPVQVVEPPSERGKTIWAGYVKSLKVALGLVQSADFGAWVAAQRETLERCPPASRVFAIRAISETAKLQQIDPPLWLADLLRPASRVTPATPESKPLSEPAASEPVSDPDERWVNSQLIQLDAITERAQFDQLVGSNAVRTIMARLRRDKPALFARADAAFSFKHENLPPAGDQA